MRRRTGGAFWPLAAELLGLLAQLLLLYVGIRYLTVDDSEDVEAGRLLTWCLIATLYLACTALWLGIDLRVRDDDHELQRRIGGRLMLWFSTIVAFSSSLVGLSAAVTLIVMRSEPDHLAVYELVAIWAMLASWALFHWGYARIYHARFHHAKNARPPLVFPGTERPRLTDFAYFSFTNGTSFSTSDVQVVDSRMRWTVVWHTTLSFFFNALIIVLTMNTITGGLTGL